jgi:hypothetical protein
MGIKLVDDQVTKLRTKKVKVGKKFETKVCPVRRRKWRWWRSIRTPAQCWRWWADATTAGAS